MNFEPINLGKKTIPKIVNERLLVKGGMVVNHDLTFRADVFIENGKIRQLGTDLLIPGGVTTIDAKGALVLPGGIDLSTNFDSFFLPDGNSSPTDVKTVDDFYSGTRAALIGGTTTVIDFATGGKERLMKAFEEKLEVASTRCCDVSLHVDVTSWNDEVKQSMHTLATMHGVNSFRVHMSGNWQLNDDELYDVLNHIKCLEGIALVHAENGSLIRKKIQKLNDKEISYPHSVLTARNEDMEFEATIRILIIAKQMCCPLFFVHVTGKKAMECIMQARAEGFPVYCQVLAVSLYRDGSIYKDASWDKAVSCFTYPPLRSDPTARQRQLQALSNQSIQCVSSGHCVYTNTNKSTFGKNNFSNIPSGCNGVYERMMVLWSTAVGTGYIDRNQFVSLTSTNAARIFNLFPRKGIIAVGSDADLVIWTTSERRLVSEMATTLKVTEPDCSNAFDGLETDGGPSVVISHGRVVFDNNQVSVVQSMGKFLERPIAPPFIYNRLRLQESTADLSLKDTPILKSSLNGSICNESKEIISEKPERYIRRSGIRAMHVSGFSFSGETNEEDTGKKSRFTNPPGGISNLRFT